MIHRFSRRFRLGDNDTRILTVAQNLAAEGKDVVLVSKDLPMRVKAASIGLAAEEYRAGMVVESGWTGMAELQVTSDDLAALFENGTAELDEARDLPATPVCGCCPAAVPRSAACCRTSRYGWCAAIERSSACTAGRPSSGSRSIC